MLYSASALTVINFRAWARVASSRKTRSSDSEMEDETGGARKWLPTLRNEGFSAFISFCWWERRFRPSRLPLLLASFSLHWVAPAAVWKRRRFTQGNQNEPLCCEQMRPHNKVWWFSTSLGSKKKKRKTHPFWWSMPPTRNAYIFFTEKAEI